MGNFCKFRETEELEIVSQSEKEYSKNEFKEIKDFRKEILEMNVFKRKEIANEKYQKFIENTVYYNNDIDSTNEIEIKDKYIQIVCLLLIDNTNKNIVILYLNFIKKYSNFIKKLVQLGGDWNVLDDLNRKPIHYAACCKSEKPLNYLLSLVLFFSYLDNPIGLIV